ncbi:carbohydrate ABC transporter permease [Nesterenkonia haasae]|uniref:carbohydrate ABC transporter permease n=1 Tax=Nesterenkonia haasae TaxID=2587813 RepID=UPI0013917601|nr:sugar ABC transporter permease [Nesterenkonia haasae]NDK32203.1 sugar ABC transporter permease [Nesterenkonia haasae]
MTTLEQTPATRVASPARRSLTGGASYWWYLIPGFTLLAVVIIIPLFWNIYLSFTDYRGVVAPEWTGLSNWIRLFGDERFWLSFRNSIAMIIAMVIVPTLLGLVIAAALFDVVARKFGPKVASFLRATYYLPQIIPAVVAAIVIGWIHRPENGALNELLEMVGLGVLANNWLGDPNTALFSIMAVLIWVQIGYPVVIFMAALERVDPELYEAAEVDGAGWFRRFYAITLPQIRPETFVVALTCTIAALKVFAPVYALTGGGPNNATIVPSYYTYSQFFQSQQVGYGATIATALTVVILAVSIIFILAQSRVERADQEGR